MTLRSLVLVPTALTLAALAADSAPVQAADGGDRAILASQIESALDRSADACTDFYQFACGGWIKNTPLPADRAIYGRGFSAIDDRNQEILRSILDEAAAGGGSTDARLGTYYKTCMDTSGVDAAGVTPLADQLAAIDALTGTADLATLLPKLPLADALFSAYVDSDLADPNVYVMHLGQGGLGLPERNYYFPKDDDGKKLLADYTAHVAKMLAFIGRPATEADAVLRVETALAGVSKAPDQLRDASKLNNPADLKGLSKLAKNIPWREMMAAYGVPAERFNVMTPDFFKGLGKVLKKTSNEDLKAYLRWHVVHSAATLLTSDMDAANFEFYGLRLAGQKVQQDRWKRCVDRTDGALGDLLGKAYIDRAFAGESKEKALAMIQDVEAAFEAGLPDLEWMDDTTRAAALSKLKSISNKIGYADTLEIYDGLQIGTDPFANAVAVAQWKLHDDLKKVGAKVDKSEWFMTPPTVNAYYNPSWNEIVFPAGILQPPFFSAAFPTSMNYGAMGMVMGHEITHGFDDDGRKFAGDGSLKEWWSADIVKSFEERAQCIVDQYGKVEVSPGNTLNGSLTLGENIADNGGIKLAMAAFEAWKARGNSEQGLAGFTPEQLFFVSYAQSWCSIATPEVEALRARTDPHSPPKVRVNIPLANLPAFGEAFQCSNGSPMKPSETCSVW